MRVPAYRRWQFLLFLGYVLKCIQMNKREIQSTMAERATMTFHTSPKVKARMDRLAAITRRSKSFLANEAVERYLAEEEEFIAAINEGIADAEAGHAAPAEEVRARLKASIAEAAHPTDPE